MVFGVLDDRAESPSHNHLISTKFRFSVFKVIGLDKPATPGCICLRLGKDQNQGIRSSALKPLLNQGRYDEARRFMPSSVVDEIKDSGFKFKEN